MLGHCQLSALFKPTFKDREANAANASIREAEIATANPLMNLQAALGQGSSTSSGGSFAVKKRWDDGKFTTPQDRRHNDRAIADLIFKNQANGQSDKPSGQFVNDLLRTEFHKSVLSSNTPRLFFSHRLLQEVHAEIHQVTTHSTFLHII